MSTNKATFGFVLLLFLLLTDFQYLILTGPPSTFSFMFVKLCLDSPDASPVLPLPLFWTYFAGRALEEYSEFKLSLPFLCSFAASDLVWLAHRSPQGQRSCLWFASALKVDLASCLSFVGNALEWQLCFVCCFGQKTCRICPAFFSKVKINMLQREQNIKKHLANQEMSSLVSYVQWRFWKNLHAFIIANFSSN